MELDETYDSSLQGKKSESVNHRQFITWREFTTYFDDYRDIRDRNRKLDLNEQPIEKISQ